MTLLDKLYEHLTNFQAQYGEEPIAILIGPEEHEVLMQELRGSLVYVGSDVHASQDKVFGIPLKKKFGPGIDFEVRDFVFLRRLDELKQLRYEQAERFTHPSNVGAPHGKMG